MLALCDRRGVDVDQIGWRIVKLDVYRNRLDATEKTGEVEDFDEMSWRAGELRLKGVGEFWDSTNVYFRRTIMNTCKFL